MAIELIDPDATLEFIPASEKESDKPTTIHLKPSDMRDALKRNRLFNLNRTNGMEAKVEFADDDIWFDYMVNRVVKIENISNGAGIITITDRKEIADALSRMSSEVGTELFGFIVANTTLTEKQRKN